VAKIGGEFQEESPSTTGLSVAVEATPVTARK